MIASLKGIVERSVPGEVVLDVHGVGYRVHVSLSTYVRLPSVGGEAKLRVVTVVREEELSLYGFAEAGEEELFRLLQDVSGVGPKLALKILSGLEPARLRDALAAGDTAMLSTVSGVGKKLAQRLAVELRDKVGPVSAAHPGPGLGADTVAAEAAAALEALGYPARVASKAVETARAEGAENVSDVVRQALKSLAPKR